MLSSEILTDEARSEKKENKFVMCYGKISRFILPPVEEFDKTLNHISLPLIFMQVSPQEKARLKKLAVSARVKSTVEEQHRSGAMSPWIQQLIKHVSTI